jgi:lysophospholipase L1-like esterase
MSRGRWPRVSGRSRAFVAVAAVLAIGLGAALVSSLGLVRGASCPGNWVAAWGTSAKAVWAPGAAHGPLDARTMRLIAPVQTDGDSVRVRLSNRYGFDPLAVASVTVGVAEEDEDSTTAAADLVDGQALPVTFGGKQATAIPAYSEIDSDPVPMTTVHGMNLAVSLYLPNPAVMISEHEAALQTSYLSVPGDHTHDGTGNAFISRLTSWPVLTGLAVHTARPTNSVLVMGDSITDGLGTPQDRNQRWPDALLEHLTVPGQPPTTTVINGGISGNELLLDASDRTGDSPGKRLSWELPVGATDVILAIGNNDIAAGRSAPEIVDGLTKFAGGARAKGVRVFLTTITPVTPGMAKYGTPAADQVRQTVNDWVRSHGKDVADGVIDLAQAVTDPDLPDRLAPQFSTDGIHLTPAGSDAMASAVNPPMLTRPTCQ